MLKVHKGRRDDVRTVHGPLPWSDTPSFLSYRSRASFVNQIRTCI